MKLNTIAPQKSRAQAMVEFAIVLPLLLLLVYGLLEAGRLLFMYSTIVTATRQASRYGSATGQGGDYTAAGGPNNSNVPRYQDCYGIRLAAQRVDFLNSFADSDISIVYDSGDPADSDDFDTCDGDADTGVTPSDQNDSRIVVRIDGNYFPIVPRIVPFLERSVANNNPIRATSARTIILGIEIEVTSPPGTGVPTAGTSCLSLTMSGSQSTFAFAGETINFTYMLTNNCAADITGLTFAPTHGSLSCPATTLAVGASMTCTGSYITTAADVNAGSISAQGTASGTDGTSTITSNTATWPLDWVEQPAITLTKSASTEYARQGGTIVYTFVITNSGNVPLTGPTISDAQLGAPFACGGDLPPLASTSCTASYVVTAGDVGDNELVNSATASAQYNTQTVTSNTANATVWTGPLFLQASVAPASVSAPGTVAYSYQLINNTGVILNPPYSLTGHRGSENCSTTTSQIAVGGSITCTGTYTVSQGDLDSNPSLVNNVQATACAPGPNCSGPRLVTSNSDSVSVTMVRNPSVALAILNVTPNPATTPGSTVTFTYSVGNTGNVTLQSPTVTDTRATGITCTPAASLAPGAAATCTGTYTITQADVEAGSISGQATATGTFNGQTVSSASHPYTITTFVGPRLRLQITPNPTTYTGVGQFIIYTYTLRNTGSVPLYGPYVISDNRVTFVDCAPATSPLAVGASTSCVGSYATTQTDMNAGNITNSANATASDGTQVVTSNSAMAVVYVPGAPTLTPSPTNTPLPTPTRTPTLTPTITATNPLCTAAPVTLTASGDAWIDENSPTTNNGTTTTLNVQSRNNRDQRTLVQFSLPTLPAGCVVQSATLRLNSASFASGRTLQALRVTGNWTETTVNWNNQPATTGTAATVSSGSGYLQWNVTSIVQTMYTTTNSGFLIRDASEDAGSTGSQQVFNSRENAAAQPQLVITFGQAP